MTLFSIKKNTLYDQDSLTKKARTSISNFLPNLKRKRSFEEEELITVITKKKKVNTMTRLFQKIAMSKNTMKRRDKSEALFDALYKFETFSLPIIEPTNGCLGIILKEKEEEDSIFSTKEGSLIEFPTPPPQPSLHKKRSHRLRQDSCPPRLNSLVIIEEESDDESLPLTPSSSTLDECELLKKIQELDINIV